VTETAVPQVRVAVALITRDDKILVQQRAKGSHLEGTWEFPGGKLEEDESWEEALEREVQEELGVPGVASGIFEEKSFEYPEKRVRLRFYWTVVEGEPTAPHRWVSARELLNLEPIPEANRELLPKIAAVLEGHVVPESPASRTLRVLAWSIGVSPIAFVCATLAFLTLDKFARIAGWDLETALETKLLRAPQILMLSFFLVFEGFAIAIVRSLTARRGAP
jgi:8-oxo-dGTP diphosphatase